jgi:hypothetical protein
MRTAYKIQIMPPQKLSDNIFTKSKRNSSVILSPPYNVFIGISPKQVAQKARIRDISGSHDSFNLLHVLQLWAQSTMHTEDLLVDNCGNR